MKNGQSTLEYVVLVGFLAAAISVMLIYISRGFQGKLREQADSLGEQYSLGKMQTGPGGLTKTWDFYKNQYNYSETKSADEKTSTTTYIRDTAANTKITGSENVVRHLNEEPVR